MFSLVHELCEVHIMMSCAFQDAEAEAAAEAEEAAKLASQRPAAAGKSPTPSL